MGKDQKSSWVSRPGEEVGHIMVHVRSHYPNL